MPVVAAIGAQWGDEGKGKVVDMLAEKADVIVRFSGGDNAGHTIINPYGKFALRLVPSGIFYPGSVCVIGNGVALNPAVFLEEIKTLNERGVNTDRLYISDRTNLIMPYHLLLDGLEEERRGGAAIGTTGKGIGPAFSDKTARCGIRAGDLLDRESLKERLELVLEQKNTFLTKVYGKEPLSFDAIYKQYCEYGDMLGERIRETTVLIDEAIEGGKFVLLEGAQGMLLDPDFGTYPYTTSSSPLSGGACVGAGIGPTKVDAVVGVFKAYCSRVGAGPFPTELKDETGDLIRKIGNEYGTVSGRPRSCGWFDAVAARFSTRVNGFTGMALTRLDILDTLPSLKICTHYKLDGKVIDYFPSTIPALGRVEPVYEEMPGWQEPTTEARSFDDLPEKAKNYINRLEELAGCPACFVCIGPEREQTIEKSPVLK